METVMTREDFRHVRHVLRFAGIGVAPAADVVDRAVDRVAMHLSKMPEFHASMERLRAGVLPSQEICSKAELQLEQFFEGQFASDAEGYRMMQQH